MVRPKQDEINKKLQQQEDDTYGDGTVSGSNPDQDRVASQSTKDRVTEVTGNKPRDTGPFSMADEVDDDEEAIREKPIDDYNEEDVE